MDKVLLTTALGLAAAFAAPQTYTLRSHREDSMFQRIGWVKPPKKHGPTSRKTTPDQRRAKRKAEKAGRKAARRK